MGQRLRTALAAAGLSEDAIESAMRAAGLLSI
jgi:hypothetical protein